MEKTIEAQRALVAEKVMDFEEWEPWTGSGKYWRLKDQPWQGWHGRQAWWKPDQDIWQAMQLAEALRQKKWHVMMNLPTSGGGSCTTSRNWVKTKDIELFHHRADTLAQAIFAVAIQVAEQMEEEKS